MTIRNFSPSFFIGSILLFLASLATPSLAESTTEPDSGSIYDFYVICDAYYEFLSVSTVGDANDCDEVSKFLISRRNEANPYRIISRYRVVLEGETPFDVLFQAYRAALFNESEMAFGILDSAGKQLLGAYSLGDSSSVDLDRGRAYVTLIDRSKIEILSTELKEDSSLLDAYEMHSFDNLGDDFAVLDRLPSSNVLTCLIITDNHRVPLRVVVSSKFFLQCLERSTKEAGE